MKEKLTKRDFLSISLMLFALLFGSGNLIFPPMLGNQAGTSMPASLAGFALTAVVFPVFGILAVAKTDGVQNLGNRVGPTFALIYPAVVFLAIGPGIAIPRNGSLAFEMSVAPYLSTKSSTDLSTILARLIYTTIFFGLTYYLCLQPGKLVDRIGKVLTPILVGLILLFFAGSLLKLPINIAPPTADYQTPFTTGILEGYNTMDILASLNFGLVVVTAIKSYQIKEEKNVIKYASTAGLVAGTLLLAIYAALAYVGMISSTGNQDIANGGRILFNITNSVFGSFGAIILVLIFTLACLTTAVGLTTSVSEYFAALTQNKITYKQWILIYTLIALTLANFGLDTILKFSLPVLAAIYPAAIMLIIMALTQDIFKYNQLTYKATIYVTILLSLVSAFHTIGISLPLLDPLATALPFYEVDLAWLLPAFITLIGGTIISKVPLLREMT